MTYAFLISLVGAAGALVLAFVWRSQRDKARAEAKLRAYETLAALDAASAIKDESIRAGKAWDAEKARYLDTIRLAETASRSRLEEFRALVARCEPGAASVVILPWVDRLLSGEGSLSGTYPARRTDRLPTNEPTPRIRRGSGNE